MTNLQVFSYNDHEITFDFGEEGRMVNATQMGQAFNKKAAHFLRSKQTQAFIEALGRVANLQLEKIVKVIRGGNQQGTWMHEKLALKFAAWLSAEFEIWVYDRIQELITNGYTTSLPITDFRVIYFLKAKDLNRVKIGMTSNLNTRLQQLKNTSPIELELVKLIRVNETYRTDGDIHILFPHLRLHGEWFRLTDELQKFMNGLEQVGVPLTHYGNSALYEQKIQQLQEKINLLQKHLAEKDHFITKLTKDIGRLQDECLALSQQVEKLQKEATATKLLQASSTHKSPIKAVLEDTIYCTTERNYLQQLRFAEILYIEGESSYSIVYLQNDTHYKISQTLSEFVKHFPSFTFVRTHKKYVLHLRFLTRIDTQQKIAHIANGKHQLPISRRQYPVLIEHLKKLKK